MAGIKIPGATSVEVIGHHMSLSAITSERISWRGRLIFLSVITCTNALPVTFLPHCGTCKLFIGHGSDARDLHDQKELHKFRASIGWARVIRRLKCKVRAAVGMEVLRENDGLLRQRRPWQSAEAPLMLASVIQVSIGRLRLPVVSAGATPN